jgi:hypothetical protein
MHLASVSLFRLLAWTGSTYLGAILTLVLSQTPLGSPLFLAVVAVTGTCYVLMLARIGNAPAEPRRMLFIALVLAVLFRIPPAVAPVGPDSDMVRYLWDGRVQQLGYNPYRVTPADPALASTHTAETAAMPSRRHRTPYPPAAQLFFRLVVAIGNSTLAMKLALVACDLLTIAVLWRWLAASGRSEWLTLAYAWNPLAVLETAHSGHIDALGALWITAAAYWLTRRRTALACVAFVLAVATKLLPIVLAPLLLGRVRPRDLVLGIALAALLYLPFTFEAELPLGAIPNVVANIRFNGPVFRALAWIASPQAAAAAALLAGLSAAVWARARLPASEPAAWAWPMAIALLGAPVIYPWYLLYLTPFLFTRATIPLVVWTISVMPVYLVWHLARSGGRWAAPAAVMMLEYGALLIAVLIVLRRPQSPDA